MLKMKKVKELLKDINIKETCFDYDTSKLTSLKIGGRSFCFVTVESRDILLNLLGICIENDAGFEIIGDGTNILLNDDYLNMVFIRLDGEFNYIKFKKNGEIVAGAAYKMTRFVIKTAKLGYDFSFLGGIPGTIGGGVIGNSGDKNQGICNYISRVKYISRSKLEERVLNIKDCNYRYRHFYVPDMLVLTDVVLKADLLEKRAVLQKVRKRIKRKKLNQPVDTKNAGSFFKNLPGYPIPIGRMIEECGLKNFHYGGAKVSGKHANFLENYKNAAAKDILVLSKIIRDIVREKFNKELEYEVKMIGFKNG